MSFYIQSFLVKSSTLKSFYKESFNVESLYVPSHRQLNDTIANGRWEILSVQDGSKTLAGAMEETGSVWPFGKRDWKFEKDCDGNTSFELKFTRVSFSCAVKMQNI